MRLVLLVLVTSLFAASAHCQKRHDLLSPLKKYSTAVRSIEPGDEDFSDLHPVAKKIGDARLVILGEDTHGDGETEKAKIRIIKFLHEKMGFDVIAWEFNYSLGSYMNRELAKDSLNLQPDKYYGFGWDADKQVAELIAYSKKTLNTAHPLIHAGFDFDRPPASPYFLNWIHQLAQLDNSLALNEEQQLLVDSLSRDIHGFLGNAYSKSFSRSGYSRSVATIKAMRDRYIKDKKELLKKEDIKAWRSDSLMMESALMDIKLDSLEKIDRGKWNRERDSCIAERIGRLLGEKYPGKKVIIWSATAHLIRNTGLIKRFDAKGNRQENWVYKQAGDYVYQKLKNQMYTIAFTSNHGKTGTVTQGKADVDTIPAPQLNSYEDIAHQTNKKYLFTDIRSIPEKEWLSNEFIACPLGYNKDQAQWNKIIDAFFFIDEMKPVAHRTLTK